MNARTNVGIATPIDLGHSPRARVLPLAAPAVRLEGGFWATRRERIRLVSLPAQWQQLEASGVLDNFRRVTGERDAPHRGFVFADTDLYKWIEAVSWELCEGPAPGLEPLLDQGIALIERAQRPDGYVHTYYARERGDARFADLRDMHELYSAGHLIQAAVAHHRATGSERLLRVACRFADLICRTFGPAESGRRVAVDGHQEVEMALVELSRETGDRRYLDQAQFFVDARGHGLLDGGTFGREYYQDHAPFRRLEALSGHAVRALYYCCGVTDLYLEGGDPELLQVLTGLFDRMVERQAYVTGGLGARHEGESFGLDHELPNARAYTETCAAVASVMWSQRMLAATGEARFADLVEATLYNAVLPGWSLDGREYFYVNPLQDAGRHRRRPWHPCACCPPNVARTLASLPAYLYGAGAAGLYVHQYAPSTARAELPGGVVEVTQRTRYPWEGKIELEVDARGASCLLLRIPSWCGSGARLSVNGIPADVPLVPGAYAPLARTWSPGDRVELELDMPVRFLESHPHVLENAGRVALARGPIVYCVEAADHPATDLLDLTVDVRRPLHPAWDDDRLGGVALLRGEAELVPSGSDWGRTLYRPVADRTRPAGRAVPLTAIPYFAWANREPGAMQVWLRRAPAESESSLQVTDPASCERGRSDATIIAQEGIGAVQHGGSGTPAGSGGDGSGRSGPRATLEQAVETSTRRRDRP